MLVVALSGCSPAEQNLEPGTASPAATAAAQTSPGRTPSSAATTKPTPSLPPPVKRPCKFDGKDLTNYNSIARNFKSYFDTLSHYVLGKKYKAEKADLAKLDQTTALLIARLRAGDVRQGAAGINVNQDMASIIKQVDAILAASKKAHPSLRPDPSPATIRASLKRQQARLGGVAVLCIQKEAAGS